MLSPIQKSEMVAFINGLQGRDQLNLCDECHKKHPCGHQHSDLLYDNGVCSVCGKIGKIVNCAIANKVVHDGIDIMDYWREGKKSV